MQFDQQYLDHLQDAVRQAAQVVDKALPPLSSFGMGTLNAPTSRQVEDRQAQRTVALDNVLAEMLAVPQLAVIDPERGQAEDVTPEDTGPR